MKLYEIFLTLHGESSFAGVPTTLVRLGECNLRCHYCDTKYAYQYKFIKTVDEIIEQIQKNAPIKNVLITGGEPLLQKKEVIDLSKKLLKQNYTIFIETNGSFSIQGLPRKTHIILDLKTPSSGECDKNNYQNLKFLSKNDELKFVIGDKNDYTWVKAILEKYRIKAGEVLLSSVYGKLDSKILAQWILRDKLKVRLQMQIHKILNIK